MNVTSSPSLSVAETVPIAFWFSSALKEDSDVNTGDSSFRLLMVTVISWVIELEPSLAVTVAAKLVLVS